MTCVLISTGAPEVLKNAVEPEIVADTGQEAKLKIVFCSDPEPTRTVWQWGSQMLQTGKSRDKYIAQSLARVCSQLIFPIKTFNSPPCVIKICLSKRCCAKILLLLSPT